MTYLTIEVPEELAVRLKPVQNRLLDILELGLREILSGEYPLQTELAEFLAGGPSSQELLGFRPSETVVDRVNDLLDKNRTGNLTSAEQAELDRYETINYFMTLVKARARQRMARAA